MAILLYAIQQVIYVLLSSHYFFTTSKTGCPHFYGPLISYTYEFRTTSSAISHLGYSLSPLFFGAYLSPCYYPYLDAYPKCLDLNACQDVHVAIVNITLKTVGYSYGLM